MFAHSYTCSLVVSSRSPRQSIRWGIKVRIPRRMRSTMYVISGAQGRLYIARAISVSIIHVAQSCAGKSMNPDPLADINIYRDIELILDDARLYLVRSRPCCNHTGLHKIAWVTTCEKTICCPVHDKSRWIFYNFVWAWIARTDYEEYSGVTVYLY